MSQNKNRRDFLKAGAAGLGAASALTGLGSLNPLFAQGPLGLRGAGDDRILVIVQLSGGNDGLDTVVPYADDAYHKARPRLRHDTKTLHKLDDYVGLHKNLKQLAGFYESGALGIVQGAGYPNPNRSHFESMDIWHAADERGGSEPYGWLGRFADRHLAETGDPNALVSIGKGVPRALGGRIVKPVTLASPSSYRYLSDKQQRERFETVNETPPASESNLDFVRRVSRDALKSSLAIRQAAAGYKPKAAYANGPLAADLRLAAALICSGIGSRVIYTTLGGFDTHTNERGRHDNLMGQLDGALASFQRDLAAQGQADRVVTMVFSEFGRRVAENASGGTDHGAAGPMFLLGSQLKGGQLFGEHPSLTDLHRGDLKMSVDFRAVYATLLQRWMKADPKPILRDAYPELSGALA